MTDTEEDVDYDQQMLDAKKAEEDAYSLASKVVRSLTTATTTPLDAEDVTATITPAMQRAHVRVPPAKLKSVIGDAVECAIIESDREMALGLELSLEQEEENSAGAAKGKKRASPAFTLPTGPDDESNNPSKKKVRVKDANDGDNGSSSSASCSSDPVERTPHMPQKKGTSLKGLVEQLVTAVLTLQDYVSAIDKD